MKCPPNSIGVSPGEDFVKLAPGEIIRLENGLNTHVVFYEPSSKSQKQAKTIICCHGFTVGHQTFDDFGRFVSDLGYQAIVYDQYGRGFSDHINSSYSEEVLIDQLFLLLKSIENRIYHELILVTSSNSSILVHGILSRLDRTKFQILKYIAFSPLFPTSFQTISNEDRMIPSKPPQMALLFSIPILRWLFFWGYIAFGWFQAMLLEFILMSYNDPNSYLATENSRIVQESILHHPGFLTAILSQVCHSISIRSPVRCRMQYQALGRLLEELHIPCLVVLGTQDAINPIRYHKPMMEWLGPQAELLVVQGANHGELLSEWEDEYWRVISHQVKFFLSLPIHQRKKTKQTTLKVSFAEPLTVDLHPDLSFDLDQISLVSDPSDRSHPISIESLQF